MNHVSETKKFSMRDNQLTMKAKIILLIGIAALLVGMITFAQDKAAIERECAKKGVFWAFNCGK